MDNYNITIPNGSKISKPLEKEEAEYWISLGMFVAHGLNSMMMVFAAEAQSQAMDEEADVADVPESIN